MRTAGLRRVGWIACCVVSAGCSSGVSSRVSAPDCGTTHTVFVVGDSTASNYGGHLHPRTGWAQVLHEFFDERCARVENRALSGRSSKSFLEQGAWAPVVSAMEEGDSVLIQFGHNDRKAADSSRFTDPFGSYKQYLTRYVTDTLAARALPVLLTPIQRNQWSGGAVSDDTHGDYPRAVRELSQALGVPLIDLAALTKSYMDRIGQTEAARLFLVLPAGESPNYPLGVVDNTHLHERGARTFAQLALHDALQQRLPLAAWLKGVQVAQATGAR